MQMPLEQARLLLGLGLDYSRADVVTAFRRKAKQAHPDVGGTAEMFRLLVEALDVLTSATGGKASTSNITMAVPAHWGQKAILGLQDALSTHATSRR